ncbi:MAG: hypothetical protein HY791_08740 [Deltaproteobacteria bacterium]|nr:hypothetical protein [Deltaproteobacteria bacterium]
MSSRRFLWISSLLACGAPPGPTFEVPPVIELFEARPFEVEPGGTATIHWRVTGANEVGITGIADRLAAEGTHALRVERSSELELIAANGAGERRAKTSVTVSSTVAIRLRWFEALPRVVVANEPVDITWNVEGASYVSIRTTSGEVVYRGGRTSSFTTIRPLEDTTVELLADGPGGPIRATRDVIVGLRPGVTLLSIEPLVISRTESAEITWSTFSARQARLISTSTTGFVEELSRALEGRIMLSGERGTRQISVVASGPRGEHRNDGVLTVRAPRAAKILGVHAIGPLQNGPGGNVPIHVSTRHARRITITAARTYEPELTSSYTLVDIPEVIGDELRVLVEAFGELGSVPDRAELVVPIDRALPAIHGLSVEEGSFPGELEVRIEATGASTFFWGTGPFEHEPVAVGDLPGGTGRIYVPERPMLLWVLAQGLLSDTFRWVLVR